MDQVRHILQIKGDYVWTISPDETVFEALRLMATKGVGALVVTRDEKMVGIVSERDYARKVVLQGRTSRDTRVGEIMTTQVWTVHPDQTVEECMEMMTEKRVRHLPVLEDNHLLGVISIGDVLKNVIYHQRQIISEMEEQVRRKKPEPIEPAVPRFAGWGKQTEEKSSQ
jgi:CBS domain-containing protein